MSLLSSFIKVRKHPDDPAPQTEAVADLHLGDSHTRDSQIGDSHIGDSHDAKLDDNVFNLLPPESSEPAAPEPVPEPIPEPKPQGSNRHPVDMTDLSRLSIDRDGRLYWDGKPVETHHRLSMSRRQIVGASLIAAFVAIGAIGATIQGAAAARDWACWLGWSASACSMPDVPRSRLDIPA
jgi:hypothetical protein